MDVVWDCVSDQKILSLLKDVGREVDGNVSRLLFIDLFRRLKTLEEENLALRLLLEELEVVDPGLFKETRRAVQEFLRLKDEQKAAETDFFSATGVPFTHWVNFKLKGKFGEIGPEE